jgi:hypothetical protein
MSNIYNNKLPIIALIIVLFGHETQAQSKMTNDQSLNKSVQNDSVMLKSGKHKSRGYFNVTSLEVLNFDFNYLNTVYSLSPLPDISTINGYQFSRHISLGLGIGFDYIGVWLPVYSAPTGYVLGESTVFYYKEWMFFIPVFIDFRVNLSTRVITPYLFCDAGYDISLNKNKTEFVDTEHLLEMSGISSKLHNFSSGSFYGALGFGIKFHLYRNIKMNIAVKFTYRGVKYTDDINLYEIARGGNYYYSSFTQSAHYNLLLLGVVVGVSF